MARKRTDPVLYAAAFAMPGLVLTSCRLTIPAITAGASRVASGLRCLHAVAITPAGSMEPVRSSISIASGLPCEKPGRLLQLFFRGLLSVHSRYGLHARRVAKRPSTPKAPTASLPPLPLRLLPGGANQFPGGSCTRCSPAPFTAHCYVNNLSE